MKTEEEAFVQKLDPDQVKQVIDKAFEESEQIINKPEHWTVDLAEMYLKKYGNFLDANHPLMVRIKVKLAGFYGRCPGYTMMDMSYNRNIPDRKKQVCQEALEALEKLQPGLSTTRGLLLYELHLPIFMSAQMDYDNRIIDVVEAKKQFEESLKYLHEAIELLKYEQNGTPEGAIYVGAVMQAQQLDVFVQKVY